jgi:hypothetical protein
MKLYNLILIILIVFLKTGNVFSNSNIFDVNNVEIEKKGKMLNEVLANQAIQKAFKKLTFKILLEVDRKKIQDLQFAEIKELVSYYQISNKIDKNLSIEKINYNISFNKEKIYDLFYKRGVSYYEIKDKEIYILPLLKKRDQVFIYNKNFFYDQWNSIYDTDLIEYILPLENIEIIQNINLNKNNLLNLQLNDLFQEYPENNLALVLIEDNNFEEDKIYIKIKILGKNLVKNIKLKRLNLDERDFYEKIIIETKREINNIVKSQNLIDVRAPSFLNVQIKINKKKSNLVELNLRLKNIDLIEDIFVQEFNNEFANLKIKYLGKLDNIINQLKKQKIILELIGNQWDIKILQ